MANRKATMTDLRVIIREFAKGTPLREIERRLGISRTSLRPYKERAEQSGKSMQELLQLEDAELHNVLSKGDGYEAAKEMQFDFAGDPLWVLADRSTGECRKIYDALLEWKNTGDLEEKKEYLYIPPYMVSCL